MSRRVMGKAAFAHLQDMSGRIQVYVDRKGLPAETLEAIKTWDMGDIISAEGTLARSGKGDLYVHMTAVELLTKSLRPLPDIQRKIEGLRRRAGRTRKMKSNAAVVTAGIITFGHIAQEVFNRLPEETQDGEVG